MPRLLKNVAIDYPNCGNPIGLHNIKTNRQ